MMRSLSFFLPTTLPDTPTLPQNSLWRTLRRDGERKETQSCMPSACLDQASCSCLSWAARRATVKSAGEREVQYI